MVCKYLFDFTSRTLFCYLVEFNKLLNAQVNPGLNYFSKNLITLKRIYCEDMQLYLRPIASVKRMFQNILKKLLTPESDLRRFLFSNCNVSGNTVSRVINDRNGIIISGINIFIKSSKNMAPGAFKNGGLINRPVDTELNSVMEPLKLVDWEAIVRM